VRAQCLSVIPDGCYALLTDRPPDENRASKHTSSHIQRETRKEQKHERKSRGLSFPFLCSRLKAKSRQEVNKKIET